MKTCIQNFHLSYLLSIQIYLKSLDLYKLDILINFIITIEIDLKFDLLNFTTACANKDLVFKNDCFKEKFFKLHKNRIIDKGRK